MKQRQLIEVFGGKTEHDVHVILFKKICVCKYEVSDRVAKIGKFSGRRQPTKHACKRNGLQHWKRFRLIHMKTSTFSRLAYRAYKTSLFTKKCTYSDHKCPIRYEDNNGLRRIGTYEYRKLNKICTSNRLRFEVGTSKPGR